jgi:hypothetical protein
MDSKGQIYNGETEKIPKDAFHITKEEELLMHNTPQEVRVDALINLRFKAWLAYNKLKPDAITKIKMRHAFRAGFYAKDLPE